MVKRTVLNGGARKWLCAGNVTAVWAVGAKLGGGSLVAWRRACGRLEARLNRYRGITMPLSVVTNAQTTLSAVVIARTAVVAESSRLFRWLEDSDADLTQTASAFATRTSEQ